MEIENIEIHNPYGFIYITTNLVNGKRYLGQKKFDDNCSWINYLGSGVMLKEDIKLFGKNNFSRNIISICYSEKELNMEEYNLSIFLNVVEDTNWYNLVYGGGATAGWHHREESKRKMSEHGIPSEETRKKMSQSAKARCTDEWRQEMSNSRKGCFLGEKNPNYGNHKLAGKNNPNYGNGRHVVQLTLQEEYITEYISADEAQKHTGIDRSSIRRCCDIKYKQKTAGGFMWIYLDDYENLINKKRRIVNG